MYLDIGKITGRRGMDIVMEIIRMRDDYIIANGHPPKTIKMTRSTLDSLLPRLDDSFGILYRKWDDLACTFDYKVVGMDVVIVKEGE